MAAKKKAKKKPVKKTVKKTEVAAANVGRGPAPVRPKRKTSAKKFS